MISFSDCHNCTGASTIHDTSNVYKTYIKYIYISISEQLPNLCCLVKPYKHVSLQTQCTVHIRLHNFIFFFFFNFKQSFRVCWAALCCKSSKYQKNFPSLCNKTTFCKNMPHFVNLFSFYNNYKAVVTNLFRVEGYFKSLKLFRGYQLKKNSWIDLKLDYLIVGY